MKGFEERRAKGEELLNFFINFCEKNNVEFLKSGYEFIAGTEYGHDNLKRLNDSTSIFIRHYPDITFVGKHRSILIEVKNSSGIEKDCYENYLSLQINNKANVLLFLKNKKLCKISELQFSKIDEMDKVANMNIPVLEGIWKHPRGMNTNDYQEYLRRYRSKNKNTSGCTFAFIDFENTPFYDFNILLKYR